jgi:hypothetical protein
MLRQMDHEQAQVRVGELLGKPSTAKRRLSELISVRGGSDNRKFE